MVNHGAARSATLDGAALGAFDQAIIGDISVFQFVTIVQSDSLIAREDFTAFPVDQGEIVSIVLKADTPVTATDSAGIVNRQVSTCAPDRIIVAAFDQTLIVDRLIRPAQLHRTSFRTDDLRITFDGH